MKVDFTAETEEEKSNENTPINVASRLKHAVKSGLMDDLAVDPVSFIIEEKLESSMTFFHRMTILITSYFSCFISFNVFSLFMFFLYSLLHVLFLSFYLGRMGTKYILLCHLKHR